jgi:ribose 5-phosphate isomerase B
MSDQQPPPEKEIAALVRQVVARTLGGGATAPSGPPARPRHRRPLLDEEMVRDMPAGSTQQLAADTIITPLARQAALERHIRLERMANLPTAPLATRPALQSSAAHPPSQTIAIGADHGGYGLKEQLKGFLATNYHLLDCGTHSTAAVDYPDIAYAVARLVGDGRAAHGIIIDGAGIGSCMVANKVPGVRAAMCYDHASAANSREHNHANVLTLGAGLIGPNLARQIVETWLATEFGSGRHAKRVEKIDRLDQRYR